MSRDGKPYPRRPWQPLMRSIDVVDLDVDALVATAFDHGADSLIVNAAGFMAFYATELPQQPRNPFMTGDFVADVLAAAKPMGIQVFGRADFSKGYPQWQVEHPDWFVVAADGQPVGYWNMYQTCFTGPYVQQYSLQVVDELLAMHPLDGLFLNFHYLPPCSCERCQAEVGRVTGSSVPDARAPTAPYERWRHRRLADHTARLRERMRAQRPDARLMAYHHLHKGWDPRLMAAVTDIWTAQISSPLLVNPADPQPSWPHWPGEEARKGRALLPEAPPLLVLSASEMFASRRVLQPGDRLGSHMMQAAVHGGSPCLALSGVPDRQEDGRPVEAMAAHYRGLRHLHGVLPDDEPLPAEIGLLYSPDSFWFGPDEGVPQGASFGHLAEFRGLYSALTDLRYPFDVDIAGRLEPERLRQRRVVIMPAVSCLMDVDASTLLDWVHRGGWLVCTGNTGWADGNGGRRASPTSALFPRFDLHDGAVDGAYLTVSAATLTQSLGGTSLVGVAGPFWTMRPAPAEADLRLLGPVVNNNPEFAFWDPPAPGEGHPGLGRRAVGEGGVVWLPWQPGALYYRYAIPEYPPLLGHELQPLVGAPPLWSDAPASVEMVLHEVRRASAPRRWILSMINDTAGGERPRLRTIPLPEITVAIDRPLSRAVSAVSGEEIAVQRRGERSELRVARLEGHEILILDA